MKETIEGTLRVYRIQRRRLGPTTFGKLLADYAFPRYYKQPHAYVAAGELIGDRHEVVVTLRGKVLDDLNPDEDNGRQIRVTGQVQWNPHVGPKFKLGEMTRVEAEFLTGVVSQESDS